MLHFAFYEYIEDKFSKEIENIEKKVVWKLSEVFNDVVLRLPEFVKITGQKDPPYYAESLAELKNTIMLWKGARTIEGFVRRYLGYKFICPTTGINLMLDCLLNNIFLVLLSGQGRTYPNLHKPTNMCIIL